MQVINGSYATANPNRFFGANQGLSPYYRARGDRFNRFVGETFSQTSATPDGYSAGGAIVLPLVAGGISSLTSMSQCVGSGLVIAGTLLAGSSLATLVGESPLAIQVRLTSSSAWLTFSGVVSVAAVSKVSGSFEANFAGTSLLAIQQPMAGAWGLSFNAAAELCGRLSMSGEWTPYTELSPQSLAQAVLNSEVESGFTLKQAQQIAAAVAAGKTRVTGTTTKTVVFRDVKDTADRVTATILNGERLTVDLEVDA